MKGVGSYNDWAYYASPSSNLSAFAAPFSVNRTNSNDASAPFVDSAESADAVPTVQFPGHPQSYGYDFFSNPVRELGSTPPSKRHGCSPYQGSLSSAQLPHFSNSHGFPSKDAFSYDQCSNGTKPSLFESQPYYPNYVASPIHDRGSSVAPNNWSSSSGFASLVGSSLGDYAQKSPEIGFAPRTGDAWNQFAELNHGKSTQVGVASSFSSKQTDITGSVVEEMMTQGCQDVKDTNNGEVSHMIGWEKHGLPISADPLDDKSCWWGTIKPTVEFSGTSVIGSPSVSLETHHEVPLKSVVDSGNYHLSYTGSYDKNSRQHDKSSRIDTVSSTPLTGLVTDLNIGNTIADGDLAHNNFYNIPRDIVEYIFKERHGFQNPHASLDNLSLRLSAVEYVNSIEKSFEGADRCNPAVDSPCWKGAPAAHFSQYEASEALPAEYVHNNEECFGSVIQEPQNFLHDTDNNVTKSCENSNSYQMHNGIVYQETNLADSPRKFSVTKFASEDCNSDDAVNAGPFQSEPSRDCGLQYLDEISEMKESSVPPSKPIYDCESGFSHTGHQVIDENNFMLQKQHTSCIGGADAGCNVNKCLEDGTSHPAEHALSSPLVVDKPTTPEKSAGKVSTQKLDVQMLVDTLHNLSELLVFHCLNDASELKERDRNVLKNVIGNLNNCALKNAEKITAAQECIFPQPETSRCAGESCELQQNASFERPQLTKVGPESSKVDLENLLVQEAKNLHFRSGKPHWKLSDSIPPRGVAEMTQEDNMTKALKRILSENFHDDEEAKSQTLLYKNLWLEAEAALCSVSYRARYNQMKIEMEKYSYKQRDMEEQSKPEVVPSLSESQSSATKVHVDPSPDSSAQDLPVLNATYLTDLSGLRFSADMNEPYDMTPAAKDIPDLESFIHNSTVSSTTKEAGDDDASVMARFHVLTARADKSCINTTYLKDLSGLKFSADMNKPNNAMTPEAEDIQDLESFIWKATVSGATKEAGDDEASVMARFRVLTARVDKSCTNAANLEEPSDIADNLAPRGRENQNQVNFCQDSPIPGKNKADYEASVMDRFHILKSRLEDSSSISSEGKLLDDTIITKNASEAKSLDVHVNPVMMHLSSYTAVDKSIPNEFLDLEDSQEIQPCGTYEFGNQPPTYYSDGLASDWEHVEKRSL